jgi:hypothetical protein
VPDAAVVKSSTARSDLTMAASDTCSELQRRPTERDGSGLWSLHHPPTDPVASRAGAYLRRRGRTASNSS